MTSRSHRSPKERHARSRAVQFLAEKTLLRGALVLQHRSCGKSYCRCQTGPKHPALSLHTRFGDRRVRIYIPPALHETVRSAIENGHQIDHLIDQVSDLNLQAFLEQKQELFARKGAPTRRALHRDGTVLCLCRKGLWAGPTIPTLTDSRLRPRIPTAAAFASVLTLFATRRGSLNGLEPDLRIPARLRGLVGARVPSADSIGRIYALMDSQPLRQLVGDLAHQLKCNKALTSHEGWYVAAVDGHEFFSRRKRCCPQCQTRTLTVDGEKVTEYYHQGAVCHLIGQDLALVLDVELLRPGEGEETAAKRLLGGCSGTTRGSSTSSPETPCTSMPPLSTSAWTITST